MHALQPSLCFIDDCSPFNVSSPASLVVGLRRLQSDFYASPSRFFTPHAGSAADDAAGSAAAAGITAAAEASVIRRADSWTPAHIAFTARDATFEYRTITFSFDDEALPGKLRVAIEVSVGQTQ